MERPMTRMNEIAAAGRASPGATAPALAVSLMLASALTLAPSAARAQDCGNPDSNGVITCADQAWASGISESNGNNPFTLVVGGGTATTVTAPSAGTSAAAAILATGPSGATGNNILIRVGSAGAVRIVRAAHPSRSRGVQLVQQGSGTATIDVRDTVTIGSSSNPMKRARHQSGSAGRRRSQHHQRSRHSTSRIVAMALFCTARPPPAALPPSRTTATSRRGQLVRRSAS